MTTWTPRNTPHKKIPLQTESAVNITTEDDVILLVTDHGDLWEEDNIPTDIWTKRLD